MNKKILDVTCGSRTIWFDKNHPAALYCDKRKETYLGYWKSGDGKSTRDCIIIAALRMNGNGAARRGRKCEKDTHMQAVRVHEADRKSANYWQQPSGRAARRLYV